MGLMRGDTTHSSITSHCHEMGWDFIWFVFDISLTTTGLLANTALMWLFLKERKSLSASTVLGLNLLAMNFIFLSTLSLIYIIDSGSEQMDTHNNTASRNNTVNVSRVISNASSMFNSIGCPLLLTCMCVERYLAVVKPVLYMRARKWEYRIVVSAMVWVVTVGFCLAPVLSEDVGAIMSAVSFVMCGLFLVMLACLGAMIRSLLQQSPAQTSLANRHSTDSGLKRQAVWNVVIVIVPAVVSYFPLLVYMPIEIYMEMVGFLSLNLCTASETANIFPMFGVFIGPLFYFSKARQMCCLGRNKKI